MPDANGKAPTAVCPHTGVTIPECSCIRCLEDQIRRNMPLLLEQERDAVSTASAQRVAWWRRRGRRHSAAA